MNFNKHLELDGKHAILSPSKPYWLNYSQDQMMNYLRSQRAAQEGTELHEIAAALIKKGLKLRGSTQTLTAYVNDAIGYGMTPEVALKYSDVCFGHADAVDFNHGLLRIHDLKTGSGPVHMEQLEIYAALFCLEYDMKPCDINMELRIYQNDEIIFHNPSTEDIVPIMDKIITFDKIINKIKEQE